MQRGLQSHLANVGKMIQPEPGIHEVGHALVPLCNLCEPQSTGLLSGRIRMSRAGRKTNVVIGLSRRLDRAMGNLCPSVCGSSVEIILTQLSAQCGGHK